MNFAPQREEMDMNIKRITILCLLFCLAVGMFAQEEGNVGHTANSRHYWAEGFSIGTSFAAPFLGFTVHKTFSPLRNSFMEIGCDLGFISAVKDADYFSVYPFAHIAFFMPFAEKGGWYIGTGGGVMIAKYIFPEGDVSANTPAFDVIAGVNFFDFLNICYTLRTNIKTVSHKVSIGYVHRLKGE